jgi:hypothetical protein
MKKTIAIQLVGTMSQTSKMPCKSFGLPTSVCNVGSKLRDIPGSGCSGCYADKGFYTLYPTVRTSQGNRLDKLMVALSDANLAREWIDAVKTLIGADLFFRWHDSGDLINERHLSLIVQVALEMPDVSFWLPTREKALVSAFIAKHGELPTNLVVRLSAPMIDGAPCPGNTGLNTSTIHRNKDPHGFECGAPSRGGYCGDCRACWNRDVSNVSYAYH